MRIGSARPVGRSRAPAATAIVAVALLAACGPTSPSLTGSAAGLATPGSSSLPAAASAGSPSATTASPGASATAIPSGSTIAVADPSLLRVVKADAIGLTLTFDAETTATEVADPSLDRNVGALATGIVAAGDSTNPTDLVIVNVIRLRDPSVDAAWFRGWRDSYDEAACARAGGVARHAESTIGGNDVFIGSCTGGAFTYHTRSQDGGLVVSLTSVGPGRLGERLLDHLTL